MADVNPSKTEGQVDVAADVNPSNEVGRAEEAEPASSSTAGQAAVQGSRSTEPAVDVEADTSEQSGTSDYESLRSSTASANSSVFAYQYENGRRYHAYRAGAYLLPNDETEQDRLDITHHVFRLCLDGNLCATSLSTPTRILDVGTGTGIWAIEMGDIYPSAEIIGTDLSPIQPGWVPPNVRFEVDDCMDAWTFPVESFDFIHARTLGGSIQDWPKFLANCFKHSKADGTGKLEVAEGRTEFWDAHDTIPAESYTRKWLDEWRRLAKIVDFDVFPKLPKMCEDAGFVNVKTREEVVPLGTWPRDKKLKEVGRFFRVQFLEMALEAYSMALFTRFGGWKELEVRALIARVKEEIKQGKMHLYTFCSFVTAERPGKEGE